MKEKQTDKESTGNKPPRKLLPREFFTEDELGIDEDEQEGAIIIFSCDFNCKECPIQCEYRIKSDDAKDTEKDVDKYTVKDMDTQIAKDYLAYHEKHNIPLEGDLTEEQLDLIFDWFMTIPYIRAIFEAWIDLIEVQKQMQKILTEDEKLHNKETPKFTLVTFFDKVLSSRKEFKHIHKRAPTDEEMNDIIENEVNFFYDRFVKESTQL